jgi:hypothetical protein
MTDRTELDDASWDAIKAVLQDAMAHLPEAIGIVISLARSEGDVERLRVRARRWVEQHVDAENDSLPEPGPPCPRCGEPMFKVQDAPDSPEFVWGHDCEPETFSDMAPGWRL